MDYDYDLCRRSSINEIHAPRARRTEFFRHAGAYNVVQYQHDFRMGGASVLGTWSIPEHFDQVVGRFDRAVERFYDELGNPRSAVVAMNVSTAIGMTTGCVEMVRPWMLACTAPRLLAIEIADRAFDAAKWHFGPIATCREPLSAVQIASASAAMAREVAKVRCEADRHMPRIFA